ncbi:MAG: alpha-ketoacid dehydrogenase subunit alpha/beta [Bryobacteraceae bacterium]
MATRIEPSPALPLGGLDPDFLTRAFRLMHLSRRLDEREILLKRQSKIFFQVSAAGHEALQVAAGLALRPGHDWVYPYYRDRALCLALGVTPFDMMLQAAGAADDPASGGRQMPSHWSSPALRIVSASSPTGTQFLQAVGCAAASLRLAPGSDEITLVAAGEGSTSEGEFWEALNAACLDRLPVVFLIEDNGWAISVPVDCQTAGGNISRLVEGFPHLLRREIDGLDFIASRSALADAVAWCRQRQGPALVHARVVRLYSHSLSDDERLYKTEAERAAEAERDPVMTFPKQLADEGVLDRHGLQLLLHEVEEEVRDAADRALQAAPPDKGSALAHLYAAPAELSDCPAPRFTGAPRTMVDSINWTLAAEMRRDSRIVVFGQDVADASRASTLGEVKGKGGVFKATAGLQREFGSQRCFNAPLAEASIVGRAIGMATRGLKPVVEIQFFDYIWPAMMQIRDELATLRWRSNGGFACPLVIRAPIGGYLSGGAVYHSQCGEVTFTHIPGLRVVMPSNALDACGLLRTAIRGDDPVLFLEHKKLYREPYNRSPDPGDEYRVPLGEAAVVKTGRSLTVVTYGALVQKAMQAALRVEKEDPAASVEVLDLRSLSPYDWPAIRASVEKTSRALVAHEDTRSWGYGAEIAARIADELFDRLDAPVRRVAALDTWVGYHPRLEDAILPQVDDLVGAMEALLAY